MPYCQGDLGDGEFDYSERPVYTHEEYINLVLRSGQVCTRLVFSLLILKRVLPMLIFLASLQFGLLKC